MYGLRVLVFGVAALLVQGAIAEPRSVPFKPAEPKPSAAGEPKKLNTIQTALFEAIARDKSADTVALLIKHNMDAVSKPCPQVGAYQIYRFSTGERTLKVKCSRQPIYAVRVTGDGGFIVLGGDGSVSEMDPSNGRIYSVFGQKLDTYLAEEKVIDNRLSAHAGAPVKAPAVSRPAPWPVWLLALNIVLAVFALILLLRVLFFRKRQSPEWAWGLNSMDKDMLVDESREVYPNVYRHPRGFFIARGRQGKRRLFRTALGGMLYRDLGLKIGEVGE